jgi:hypothetical protein
MKPLAWLHSMRDELARNPRLRLGLLVIVALVILYQIAGLSQVRDRLGADYADRQAQLMRIRSISREDAWGRRAAEAAAVRKALEAEIPQADSIGLAQATFQGWLRELSVSGNAPLSIAMGTPTKVQGLPGYWKIPAQLSGSIGGASALELVRKIESRKDLVVIDSIRLAAGNGANVSIDVATYYRITP